MRKLVLSIVVALFFGCSSSPQYEGYYEQGLYIPTHVIACVDFCEDRGKVFTLTHPGESKDLCECKCNDGSIRQVEKDTSDN